MACAAAARLPLTGRGETLTVIPATLPADRLAARIEAADAAAIIKLGRHFAKARDAIVQLGLLDRAVYVERASLPNQRVLPLAEVTAESVPYFAMILLRGNAEASW
jgi:precorrin-2/cobalt-factor-2 C20-methyltransferase